MLARFRPTSRRTLALAAVVATPVALLSLSLLGLFPWSGVNCWENEVDIQSGRIRYTRYLLWLPIDQSIHNSALTEALSAEERTDTHAEWHPVVTLSPRVHHSPHYRFHAALFQIRELELCWDYGKFTPAARRASGNRILQLWRETGSDSRAKEYIRAIGALAVDAVKEGRNIDANDLAIP
jgi:hypothetical protein